MSAEPLSVEPPTADDLVREALHLRQYGEYAPGGTENWRDWDRKATAWAYAQIPGAQ